MSLFEEPIYFDPLQYQSVTLNILLSGIETFSIANGNKNDLHLFKKALELYIENIPSRMKPSKKHLEPRCTFLSHAALAYNN